MWPRHLRPCQQPRVLMVLILVAALFLLMLSLQPNLASYTASWTDRPPSPALRAKEDGPPPPARWMPAGDVTRPAEAAADLASGRGAGRPGGENRGNGSSSLVDRYGFTINEPHVCDELRPGVFTLIYVHTAPAHFKHRAVIRQTFGSAGLYHKLGTVTLFFVGRSEDRDLESGIRLESQRYRDVIQGDYLDSYRNLSLKALSALTWIREYCPRATYVLKVDDDMFVNVFNLVRHLNFLRKYEADEGGHIHCLVWHHMGVIRDPKSKWYVSPEEFADDHFPEYCSGSAFFMQMAVVPALHNASRLAPFLWVDDAYATGVLARAAHIGHNTISSIVVLKQEEYDARLIGGEAVFGHMTGDKGVDLRRDYWKKVLLKEDMS